VRHDAQRPRLTRTFLDVLLAAHHETVRHS
jgi:hypothetical protein